MNWVRLILLNSTVILVQSGTYAQHVEQVTIDQCYQWAKVHYPLADQLDIINQIRQYNSINTAKGFLPQINIYGQASYQSEVTKIPIEVPGLDIPTLSKDQYKIYTEFYQPLSSSQWSVRKQKQTVKTNAAIERQQLEVDLYKLRDRVSQLYFGVLLMKNYLEQSRIFQKEIEAAIKKVASAIANGTAVGSSKKVLEGKLIIVEQRIDEQMASRDTFIAMLALLTGKNMTISTKFSEPSYSDVAALPTINRPELMLFLLQKQQIEIKYSQINNRFWPNIGLFAQGGYGRPTLDFLNNDFNSYYVAGVRMSWRLSGLYTSGNEKQILKLSKSRVNKHQASFLLNTKLSLVQQENEIKKYKKLIKSDKALIDIQEDLKKTAQEQLAHGLISALDFIDYISAEDEARQKLSLHRIQLAIVQYKYKTLSGN